MRSTFVAALLLVSAIAVAQDAPKIAISIEPLGDDDHGIVTRVFFRFANPRAITEAGLFLEGSFRQAGRVPRNFRYAVPRKGDKMIWEDNTTRNGKLLRSERWALLPDQQNQMETTHTFAAGELEIDVWLVLEGDRDGPSRIVGTGTETFPLAKTNRPFAAEPAVIEEPPVPERAGAVTVRAVRRNGPLTLFEADVLPPVKRVEFWVDDEKIIARNTPPYRAELPLAEHAAVRAIGYDASGRYIDADAFVESSTLVVKLTRTVTRDGMSHFKVSIHNPERTPLQSVALYAGDRKLHEWSAPPYALSLPAASLADVKLVHVTVIDASGNELRDQRRLD